MAGLKKANIEIAVDRQEIQVRPTKVSTENADIDPFAPEKEKN